MSQEKKGRRQFCEDRRRAFKAVWDSHQAGLTPLPLNELIGYVQFSRIRDNLELLLKDRQVSAGGELPPAETVRAIRESELTPDGLNVTVNAIKDLAQRTFIDVREDGVLLTPLGQRCGFLKGY